MSRFALLAAIGTAALLLSACTYDYLQRTDRVGYSAGDAVRANLEAQTIDPARDSSYSTKGLGKRGYIEPKTVSGGMGIQDPAEAANAQ